MRKDWKMNEFKMHFSEALYDAVGEVKEEFPGVEIDSDDLFKDIELEIEYAFGNWWEEQ